MSSELALAECKEETPPLDEPAITPVVTVIESPSGWQLLNVRELWQFRELIFFLAWRDVKVRYKQTVLGAAWAVLQPALMMVVFTIFFSRMAGMSSGDIPYPLFAFAGLLLDKEGKFAPDYEDEILKAALVTQGGKIVNPALGA